MACVTRFLQLVLAVGAAKYARRLLLHFAPLPESRGASLLYWPRKLVEGSYQPNGKVSQVRQLSRFQLAGHPLVWEVLKGVENQRAR